MDKKTNAFFDGDKALVYSMRRDLKVSLKESKDVYRRRGRVQRNDGLFCKVVIT